MNNQTSQLQPKANRWFTAGIERTHAGHLAWRKTRAEIFTAGLYFTRARAEIKNGDWTDYLELNRERISPRTVYRCIQFCEEALEAAAAAQPKLRGADLEKYAAELVTLPSPKPLVALLRTLKKPNADGTPETDFELLPFGLYSEVRYAQRKIGGRQIEFDFVSVSSQIDLLTHLDEPNYSWKLPEGTDEPAALRDLKAKLETVLEKIEAKLKDTIEV